MKIINMSEASAIAIHGAVILATRETETVCVAEIAAALHASPDHCAKVMQRLAKADLVTAVRGPGGGYRLAKSPAQIRLADVVGAIEGRITDSYCLFQEPQCRFGGCLFAGLLSDVHNRVRAYFEETSLAMMAEKYRKLDRNACVAGAEV